MIVSQVGPGAARLLDVPPPMQPARMAQVSVVKVNVTMADYAHDLFGVKPNFGRGLTTFRGEWRTTVVDLLQVGAVNPADLINRHGPSPVRARCRAAAPATGSPSTAAIAAIWTPA
jgi:hypothetical protein